MEAKWIWLEERRGSRKPSKGWQWFESRTGKAESGKWRNAMKQRFIRNGLFYLQSFTFAISGNLYIFFCATVSLIFQRESFLPLRLPEWNERQFTPPPPSHSHSTRAPFVTTEIPHSPSFLLCARSNAIRIPNSFPAYADTSYFLFPRFIYFFSV